MIGKVPKAGADFKGLVRYLLHGKGGSDNPDRVAWTDVRNLAVDDPTLVPSLMYATASRNRRCRAPVYHFVISWHHNEHPTDAIMRQVADTTCDDLELTDHQRFYVAHADTKQLHLHVVVNRIHPETAKAWNRRQDWVRIEQSLADQSRELGMDYVPGRHTEAEPPRRRPRRVRDATFQKVRRQQQDAVLKHWSDERISKERESLTELVDRAASWDDLHEALAERGMLLVRKGQGLVIADVKGAMKLSNLGKGYGLKGMTERLGSVSENDVPTDSDKERIEALGAAGEVGERLDFAFSLYRMGLVSAEQIDRLMIERAEAQTALDATLSLRERVQREVAEALRRQRSEKVAASNKQKSRSDRDR